MIAIWCGLTFALGAAAVWMFLGISRRRLLDVPGDRSSHARPTPSGGGFPAVMVWLVLTVALVATDAIRGGPRFWSAALFVITLAPLGLADDAIGLPRSARYLVQALASLLVVHWLGVPAPSLPGPLALATGVLFLTVLINCFNFMDGMDALVAGSSVITLGFLAWFTKEPLWALLAAAYAGFLVFNLPPARIFMGDAGSTTLGALIGVAFLAGRASLRLEHLALMGPLMGDALYTLLRRLLRGENIFRAHHSHVYQRLFRAGHTHARVSLGYAVATLLSGTLLALDGARGALIAATLLGAALLGIEFYLRQRGILFTRPASTKNPA